MLKLISYRYRIQWHCKSLPYSHFNCHVYALYIMFRTRCY